MGTNPGIGLWSSFLEWWSSTHTLGMSWSLWSTANLPTSGNTWCLSGSLNFVEGMWMGASHPLNIFVSSHPSTEFQSWTLRLSVHFSYITLISSFVVAFLLLFVFGSYYWPRLSPPHVPPVALRLHDHTGLIKESVGESSLRRASRCANRALMQVSLTTPAGNSALRWSITENNFLFYVFIPSTLCPFKTHYWI